MFTAETIAQVCHEANRVLQEHLGEAMNDPWAYTEPELRESAINGVENALQGATPEESHENWMEFKSARGWSHGNVKDFEAKTHPCMVPYEELPETQKIKDKLFTSIVQTLGSQ